MSSLLCNPNLCRSFYGLEALVNTENEIEGVKILNPPPELHQHSDILGPDMVVKNVKLLGSFFQGEMFCDHEVKMALQEWVFPSACLMNPCKMACFHTLSFIRHYLKETHWEMDDDPIGWNSAILQLMCDLDHGFSLQWS